ncbi:peptidase M13 [Dermabacteraceae bacterium TAE3-ERU5]|nr:peptidase M13 [Dermabacteraceae bacterium TAE3-ERU5]
MTTPSGITYEHCDKNVRIQDDAFRHMNGAWLENYKIPADRASDGAFREVYDRAEADVREIVENSAEKGAAGNANERLIGALYSTFMDADAINAAGIAPLRPVLAEIAALSDHTAATAFMNGPRAGITLFEPYVWSDLKDSTRYLLYLSQAGLGLPDESYYREDSKADIRAKYLIHLAEMARLAELQGDPAQVAERVMAFETELATHHWDVVSSRDADKTYNPRSLAEIKAMAPEYDWDTMFASQGVPAAHTEKIGVRQPDFLPAAAALYARTDLSVIKEWLAVHTLAAFAPYLSDEIAQAAFEFNGKVLKGLEERPVRWKRGVDFVEGAAGEAVGELFVAKHFPPSHKQRMEELVSRLIDAYRESISSLEWMTAETREKALEKLSKFTPKIGYPVKWRDYSGLEVVAGNLVETRINSLAFERAHALGKLNGPIDRDEWHMTPQTVNAYYNPGANEIVFPAAFLRPPFFNADADDAANYGGVGGVIGHEIGHGFDDQGSKYDGDGNLRSWWTEADRKAFEERTSALIAQYDALTPSGLSEENKVNGAFTIGENIGDLGGLGIAVKAYLASLEGEEAPEIDGYTGLQRVFLGWAQVWRGKSRPEDALYRLAVDPHSPAEFRCNQILKNVDSFYEAFGVKEGDGMYLAPEDRVSIW